MMRTATIPLARVQWALYAAMRGYPVCTRIGGRWYGPGMSVAA